MVVILPSVVAAIQCQAIWTLAASQEKVRLACTSQLACLNNMIAEPNFYMNIGGRGWSEDQLWQNQTQTFHGDVYEATQLMTVSAE